MLSLYLSDGEETPELSNDFISYGLTLNRFINLKSFSLFRLHSISTLNKLLINVYQPFHLTHLQIIQCYFGDIGDFNRLIINIWRLPNLRHYPCKHETQNCRVRTRFYRKPRLDAIKNHF